MEVIPLSCNTGYEGVDTCDFGMAVFKYPNGVSFAKTCDVERGGFLRRQLVICGEKGTIEIKPFEKYIEAKFNVAKFQSEEDYLIYNYDNENMKKFGFEYKENDYAVSLNSIPYIFTVYTIGKNLNVFMFNAGLYGLNILVILLDFKWLQVWHTGIKLKKEIAKIL